MPLRSDDSRSVRIFRRTPCRTGRTSIVLILALSVVERRQENGLLRALGLTHGG